MVDTPMFPAVMPHLVRRRVPIDCSGKGRTEQHHKKACNVNNIIKKYNKTGLLQQRLNSGIYGDFTGIGDYLSCIQKVQDAHDDFMAVDSKIRKRFRNDPALLIEFVSNDDNREEAISLGLLPKEAPVEPVVPPVEPEVPVEPPPPE